MTIPKKREISAARRIAGAEPRRIGLLAWRILARIPCFEPIERRVDRADRQLADRDMFDLAADVGTCSRHSGSAGPLVSRFHRGVKTTRYFEEQVLRKRPYLREQWITAVLRDPMRREPQPDGRVRYWGYIPAIGKYLRVVTLADGKTVHNAFPDRGFGGTE
jgi:hypothetical protein